MSPSQGSTIDSQFGTPWTVEYRGQFNYLDGLVAPFAILSESGEVIGFFFKAKEAAGARDCVNACEGVDDDLLADDCFRKTREDRDNLMKQRDELLEALKGLMALSDHRVDLRDAAKAARAAIAKATREPA